MADNATPHKRPEQSEALAAAITTDQVRAIVESVLHEGGYVTAETVTRLMDKQTLTFQATVTNLRDEISEQIKTIRGDFTDEMKEWRSTIRDLDSLTRQVLNQNIEGLKLSSNIQGQNTQIAATLDRFSTRMDDFSDDMDVKLKASFSDFSKTIKRAIDDNAERITKLEQKEQWRTGIENHIRAIPNALSSFLSVLAAAVKFVSNPKVIAIIIAIGAATGISMTTVIEYLKALGGG